MGQMLSHAYHLILNPPRASLHEETISEIESLYEKCSSNLTLKEFLVAMESTKARNQRYVERFTRTRANPKHLVMARSMYEPKFLSEKIRLKEGFLQNFEQQDKEQEDSISDEEIESITRTVNKYMAQVFVHDYLLTLKTLKFVNGYASVNALEKTIDEDYPLEDLEDDLPLMKAEFTGWWCSEQDSEYKSHVKKLIDFLDVQLQDYLNKAEVAADATDNGVRPRF